MYRLPRVLAYGERNGPTFNLVARGPFGALADRGACEVRFLLWKEAGLVKHLLWCDAAFIVRPMSRWSLITALLARALRRHVIVYWDDDLFSIPRHHLDIPHRYENPQLRRNMRLAVAAAHLLAAANPRLITAFQEHGLHVVRSAVLAVPALGVDLTQAPPSPPTRLPPTIGYAGSVAHANVVQRTLVPALTLLRRAGVDFRCEIAGPSIELPSELAAVTSQIQWVEFLNWLEYRNQLQWDIAVAPLPEGPFFECKFYNKFVDYTAAGIPGIYSNVPPYTDVIEHGVNGWLTDNAAPAWADAIHTLLSDAGLRARLRAAAWEKLATEHAMDAVVRSYQAGLGAALAPVRRR